MEDSKIQPIPTGIARHAAFRLFLDGLFERAPLRRSCTREISAVVAKYWDEHRGVLYGQAEVDELISDLRADVAAISSARFPGVNAADVGCTLAEAFHHQGRGDEATAFRDYALQVPDDLVRDSTRRRLVALPGSRPATKRGGPTDRQRDVMQALPARTNAVIAAKLKSNEEAVKPHVRALRDLGWVEGGAGADYKLTAEGLRALATGSA